MSKNLLDKSYDEMAFGFMRGNKKSKKKNRIVQGLSFLLNLSDRVMNNRVNKNLNALRDEKVFDIANRNDKWVKLSKVIDTENNYRNNPNYFMGLATQDFNTQQPNFNPNENDEAKNYMNAEIKELSAAKLREHQKQLEGVDVDMTKEQFMKPLEDYYKAKQEEIMDPTNRSVIHKGLSFLGLGRKRQAENAEKIKDAEIRKAALGRSTLGYLQAPTFTEKDAIDLSRTEFKYNAGEASRFIQGLEDVDVTIKNNIISNLEAGKNYSDKELNNLVFINSQNWNVTTAKVNERVGAYNSNFLAENNLQAIPKSGSMYNKYLIGKKEVVGNALGYTAGSKTIIEIENLLIERDLAISNKNNERLDFINARLKTFEPEDRVEAFQDLLLKEWFTNEEISRVAESKYKESKGMSGDSTPAQSEVLTWWLGESLKGYENVIYAEDK